MRKKHRPMTNDRLATLKFLSLLFLLPGLGGLLVSAMISTHYLETMPRFPMPEQLRTVPRNIHGVVVYQSEQEDLKLDQIEYGSVGVFLVGLGLGLTYLEKWGAKQALEADGEDSLTW
jgi:hypothetical protein